jgi:hypothetical protein
MPAEMVDVVLSFEGASFKIYIDLNDPAALFFTQVYLATSVWPPRQKITGFLASDGQVTIAPLLPDANFKSLNIQKGMTLNLTQCVTHPFPLAALVARPRRVLVLFLFFALDCISLLLLLQPATPPPPHSLYFAPDCSTGFLLDRKSNHVRFPRIK